MRGILAVLSEIVGVVVVDWLVAVKMTITMMTAVPLMMMESGGMLMVQ